MVALYITVYIVFLSKLLILLSDILGCGNVAIQSFSVAMRILDLNCRHQESFIQLQEKNWGLQGEDNGGVWIEVVLVNLREIWGMMKSKQRLSCINGQKRGQV